MFKDQSGCNIEVYMDNLLVKSKEPEHDIADMCEAFVLLWQYKMKLNLAKCAFSVDLGKFLGFMVSKRKIEAKPKTIKAIINMKMPGNLNEV